ncbi:MAG: hypothetical protein GC151_13890 [Betaproteobacteria bacterium]|nr:hypothetical protein [Betaproteobacteria bacterium]
MAFKFKAWGLDGSLGSFLDFSSFNGNGVQVSTSSLDADTRGDRVDTVIADGYNALRVRRHEGDPMAGSGHRTELVPGDYSQDYDWTTYSGYDANESVRWYRVCFLVPSSVDLSNLDWIDDAGNWLIPFQLHQVPDTGETGTPAFAIRASETELWIRRNVDTSQPPATYNTDIHDQRIVAWPMARDTWHDIVIHVRWSYSTAGFMHIWLNRRLIYTETGVANCPNNHPDRGGGGQYPKMGIYEGPDREMEILHRGLIIGDYAATWSDMYPEEASPVELPMIAARGARLASSRRSIRMR